MKSFLALFLFGLLSFSFGVWLIAQKPQLFQTEPIAVVPAQSCIVAPVVYSEQVNGYRIEVKVGETALCSTGNLTWANTFGPTFDGESALAEAQEAAQVWRDCAENVQLCPEGFKRRE